MGRCTLAKFTNHIVKRAGHTEAYDRKKLFASIYAACLVGREATATAELIAAKVVSGTEQWLETKHEVTSNDIRRMAARFLKHYNNDAAFLYLHHRVIH
jgi:transcriptional regulator NrdR family protein